MVVDPSKVRRTPKSETSEVHDGTRGLERAGVSKVKIASHSRIGRGI